MKIEYVCLQCRKRSETSSEKVELREDGTLLFEGEKFVCRACGNDKFAIMKKA